MALSSIGGGLPVGFKTVYKGCSAAAAVPAQAIAMPRRPNLATPWEMPCASLVSFMPIFSCIRILQRGLVRCNGSNWPRYDTDQSKEPVRNDLNWRAVTVDRSAARKQI